MLLSFPIFLFVCLFILVKTDGLQLTDLWVYISVLSSLSFSKNMSVYSYIIECLILSFFKFKPHVLTWLQNKDTGDPVSGLLLVDKKIHYAYCTQQLDLWRCKSLYLDRVITKFIKTLPSVEYNLSFLAEDLVTEGLYCTTLPQFVT